MWMIQLFGELRAQAAGALAARGITRCRTKKCEALLGYLAYHLGREQAREHLVELFWPECEPAAGRNNLSKELSWLRDQLEPPGVPAGSVLVADKSFVRLNPDAAKTDVQAFLAALEAGEHAGEQSERARALDHAVQQYRGELLAGHYDEWILEARQWLAEKFRRALRERVALAREAGETDRAIDHAHQWVAADPLDEEGHGTLMRLYVAAGRPEAALRQYRELERLFRQQLAAAPSAQIRLLAEQLQLQQSAGAPEPVPARPASPELPWEPDGGAVPLDSPYYVARSVDASFHTAIERQDSLVLLKGARQMGKTSLLARGLDQARRSGAAAILTDFQMLNAPHLQSVEQFLMTLAQWIASQLDGVRRPQETWNAGSAPSVNFELYFRRELLGKIPGPVVWGLDEVDRLFSCPFSSEVFGLFRSWHNRRPLDPGAPWGRLTLAIAYATDARLFITDLNQSPFNVGTRLLLDEFTLDQVADLNERIGRPLRDGAEVARFYGWVGGHPYLVHQGLRQMAAKQIGLSALRAEAALETGVYGDHLRRLALSLVQDAELSAAMRQVLQGRPCPTLASFYRLHSAGVIAGDTARDARPRCRLYADYLTQHGPASSDGA